MSRPAPGRPSRRPGSCDRSASTCRHGPCCARERPQPLHQYLWYMSDAPNGNSYSESIYAYLSSKNRVLEVHPTCSRWEWRLPLGFLVSK